MGNAGSTRKISLQNEDPASVIKVSDSVVQRLKGAGETESQDDARPKNSNSSPSQQQYINENEPSKTSLEVRREKEAEIRNNDVYWERRLAKLQDTHNRVNRRMEEEYEAAVQEVKKSFPKMPVENQVIPCQDAKAVVINCYKQHPRQTLLCAKEVEAFSACIDMKRRNIMSNKA
ncbi:MICOS complex subunit MIC19-like [Schistocerca cancellata]|uniref:MICOS complex subunit MIC19-like n=1 Tax=Schistocerca cancellata TaxID=274614 RepID=UPI0021194761|nr:MICOS complex subunit MIC19-like [Schistocerca cancellata]